MGGSHLQTGATQASRRRHFRLETALTPCVLRMGAEDAAPLKGQAGDIGGGGLLFLARGSSETPAIGATGSVEFELLGEAFTFPVALVRRVESAERCELALAWPAAPAREVDRLMYCLYKLETAQRRSLPTRSAEAAPDSAAAPAWRRDWLLVGALGVACGALLPPHLVLPTGLIALLLAVWLVTAPR